MTREALISAAEVLMAEQGIDAVDLHEVQQLAGARNRSAVQYHFENREGLVAAVLNPHRKLVNERRLRMLDRIVRTGDVTPQTLVDVWIVPLAEHLQTGRARTTSWSRRSERPSSAGSGFSRGRPPPWTASTAGSSGWCHGCPAQPRTAGCGSVPPC